MSSTSYLLHNLIECIDPTIPQDLPQPVLWEAVRRGMVGPSRSQRITRAYGRVMARVGKGTALGLGPIRVYLTLDLAWHASPYLRRVMPHVPRWTMPAVELLSGRDDRYASAKLLLAAAETEDLNLANAYHELVDAWQGLRPGERWPYGNLVTVGALRAARERLMRGRVLDPFLGDEEGLPVPSGLDERMAEERIFPLSTVGAVLREAESMQLCLAEPEYVSAMRQGRIVAFAVREPERGTMVVATDGIGDGWHLHELVGRGNALMDEPTEACVCAWCRRRGVEYRSRAERGLLL